VKLMITMDVYAALLGYMPVCCVMVDTCLQVNHLPGCSTVTCKSEGRRVNSRLVECGYDDMAHGDAREGK
jgi:hypothetical protein